MARKKTKKNYRGVSCPRAKRRECLKSNQLCHISIPRGKWRVWRNIWKSFSNKFQDVSIKKHFHRWPWTINRTYLRVMEEHPRHSQRPSERSQPSSLNKFNEFSQQATELKSQTLYSEVIRSHPCLVQLDSRYRDLNTPWAIANPASISASF